MADADELLRRCQRGDEAALTDLVRLFEGRIFRLAYRVTGDAARAEEATADALAKVWAKCGQWRGDSAAGTWVYRVALRVDPRRPTAGGGGRGRRRPRTCPTRGPARRNGRARRRRRRDPRCGTALARPVRGGPGAGPPVLLRAARPGRDRGDPGRDPRRAQDAAEPGTRPAPRTATGLR